LKAFAGDTPWVHLDIAGTAYLDGESAWQAKGPTGTPVRAFVALVEQLAGSPVIHTNGMRATANV
jgi:leucyl aminopeptidase